MPNPKLLLQAPEYVQFERKKEVQCEIISLDIKSSSTDSLRMLVFKISKGDKTDKKREAFYGYGQESARQRGASMDEFKQVSVIEESPKTSFARKSLGNTNETPDARTSTKKVVGFSQDLKPGEEFAALPITQTA